MNSSIFNSELITELLPNAIQKSLDDYSHLGILNTDLIVAPFFMVALAVVLMVYIKKKRWHFRLPVYLFLCIVIGRLLLWNNPVAWYVYYKTLDWKDVGSRQVTVMADQVSRYFSPSDKLKYLAVGSSQTGAVYSKYAKKNEHLYKVQFSGMGPVEYFLHRGMVDRLEPEYVLLYLSEFDLGRKPNYSTFRYAPFQGTELYNYGNLILSYDDSDSAYTALKEIVLGNIFSEYRFSFIYKGYLKKLLDYNNAFASARNSERTDTDNELKPNQARSLNHLSSEYIGLSLAAIKYFLRYCHEYNTKVIIVEGQYHPDAYSENNNKLNEISTAGLRKISQEHANTFFIPKEALPPLSVDDYRDIYHVSDKRGEQHATNILTYIKNNIEVDSTPASYTVSEEN